MSRHKEMAHSAGLRKWILLAGLLLAASFPVRAFASPAITIAGIPTYGNLGFMSGTVSGVDYSQYRVAAFIYVPGLGWYTKPFYAQPTVAINPDGTWSAYVTTGGWASLDPRATIYGAWLVPANYTVPLAGGSSRVSVELDAFAHDLKERYGRTVDFAGRTWAVKDAPQPVDPGGNRFSNLSSDLWSDSTGLHLTLHQHDGSWWSTEVTLLGAHLGYGTYSYHTISRTDNLDVNVTFGGGFTFDDYGDEQSPDGSNNREIDMGEDSRWGAPAEPNTQNVKQPHNYAPASGANRHRFNLPDLSGDAVLTRIMIWKPESIRFITLQGNYSPVDYPPSAVVDDYTYTHKPAAGRYVPVPGRERFHWNLWINQTVNPNAPTDGLPVEVTVSDFTFSPRIASEDLNGDGKSDIIWYNANTQETAAWLLDGLNLISGAGLLGPNTEWTVKRVGDFNGDGKSDIVWQHTDGSTAVWLMNGLNFSIGDVLLGPGTGWKVQNLGDFNGDGKSDIVWQHTDGSTAVWLMDGLNLSAGAGLLGPGTGWSVKQVGDFNGDGKSDIVWQHTDGSAAVWLMDGLNLSAGAGLLGSATGWSAKQIGDFNGDGKSDIVWQHLSGSVALWLMNGLSLSSGTTLLSPGTSWSVKQIGDINGDGKSDIVWQNFNGSTALWIMNGLNLGSGTVLLGAGSGWSVKQLGDFDADGKADLLWQHSDGSAAIWLSAGERGGLLGPGSWIPVP